MTLRSEKAIESWKKRKDYLGESKNSSMYNTHRSICYTMKGKKIGYPMEWQLFSDFKKEVAEGFKEGYILVRKDKKKPYSKDNCFWTEKGTENVHKLVLFTWNNITKTLPEWCEEYNLNYNGVKQRYFRGKNYTKEEILFGKTKGVKKSITDINEYTCLQKRRDKVSKMLSSYKNKDAKKNRKFDLTHDYLLNNIISKPCVYCGDVLNVGCDRIDNSKGHSMDNVVPACYVCNTSRNDYYSYEEMLILGKTIKKIKDDRRNK